MKEDLIKLTCCVSVPVSGHRYGSDHHAFEVFVDRDDLAAISAVFLKGVFDRGDQHGADDDETIGACPEE